MPMCLECKQTFESEEPKKVVCDTCLDGVKIRLGNTENELFFNLIWESTISYFVREREMSFYRHIKSGNDAKDFNYGWDKFDSIFEGFWEKAKQKRKEKMG
jgi:hypothetical protein